MTRLVLAGGGHAHLFVLRELARCRPRDLEVTLISPSPWMSYSGMLPGWMAGHYRLEECRIDLRPLSSRAGAGGIWQALIGMDADRREVRLEDGRALGYDLLSIDVGSETECESLANLGGRLTPVKPLLDFQARWLGLIEAARRGDRGYLLLVAGGGAAGVELSMAARVALRRVSPASSVTLVAGQPGLVPTHGERVRQHVERALKRLAVDVIDVNATGLSDGVLLDDGRKVEADHVIAATGARAPRWLKSSRLAKDAFGYIAVDAFHRSTSHESVFAAGDVCSRAGSALARSGVHAVRAAPVLAHNLLAALDQRPLRPFAPSRRSLYLLSTGDGRAIGSWGGFAAEGAWVGRLKDVIDRRFVRSFTTRDPNRQD